MKSWARFFSAVLLSLTLSFPAWSATPPAKSNPEWKPKTTERWIEVVKKERKLYLRQGEKVLKSYRIAIGSGKGVKKTPIDKVTPVGVFSIRRIADPTNWVFDPKVFNEPGEPQKGVYGKVAISFRNPWNLAIHGTNAPWSIGKAVTHGCIRLKNPDIEELAKQVKPGMKLVIREKPIFAAKPAEPIPPVAPSSLPAPVEPAVTVPPVPEPAAVPAEALQPIPGTPVSGDTGTGTMSETIPASSSDIGTTAPAVPAPIGSMDLQAPAPEAPAEQTAETPQV